MTLTLLISCNKPCLKSVTYGILDNANTYMEHIIVERANISISDLSLSQKLDLMESIWNDLSSDEKSLQSPDWHKEILNERDSAHKQGKLKTSNWSDAKKRIKRNLGCE